MPPGSPLIGRPDTADAKRLAPVPAPPLAAAADKLPVDKLKVPKGFKVEVYASGMPNARSMALGDKGTVFVGSRLQDKVYAIVDKGGKREVKIIASGLYRPNGVAFKNGTLYIMELSQLSKIDNIEDNLDNPPKPTVILDGLPKDEAHGWKYIAIGPDNKLYFEIGQPCNNCLPPEGYGTMRRVNLDGKGMETIAQGIRNTVGFDWHPTSKELYFTDNSRDWMSEDLPNDELNRMTKVGQHFGSPFCYQGNLPDQEFGWGRKCEEFTPPIALMGPHTASLGMKFYTGNSFPAKYKNQILVARHGSWNKTNKLGGDVVLVNIKKDGSAGADRAVPHRLSRQQQLCRAAGGRDADEGRVGAGLRRLERRGLAGERRRQRPHRHRALMDRGRGRGRKLPARSLQSRPVHYKERWS